MESKADVVPSDYSYPPGSPERYGAVGDGVADDTFALTQAIACSDSLTFSSGSTYAVTTIRFPAGRHFLVDFNSAHLRGISKLRADCIVRLETEGSTFLAYDVDMAFNLNYTCGTWWYNASASSQFNVVLGMTHRYGTRGLVYGELPGAVSTRFAQSENAVFGFRTRGVQNPFYGNHQNGVLFFSQAMFVSLDEEWPSGAPFDWVAARAFENHAGLVHLDGGEIQLATTIKGYAADLANCRLQGVIIETSEPLRIIGDSVRITGGRTLMTRDDRPQFLIESPLAGVLGLDGVSCYRPPGVGSYSNEPLVDARQASLDFEVRIDGGESVEWRWSQVGADVKLVNGAHARYGNHHLKMTDAAPGSYVLSTGTDSLLDAKNVDRMGYTTTGWYLDDPSGTGTLTATRDAGPPGYPAAQLALACKSTASAWTADARSVRATAVAVRPGELYWVEARMCLSSGRQTRMLARFFTVTLQTLPDVVLADTGSIGSSWKAIESPFSVPGDAAYIALGIQLDSGLVRWTDFRLRSCS
ncbi:MAG: hypothetical protein WAU49_03370 [Steroidobacteraceae bacterium]